MTETGISDEIAYQRAVDRYAPLVRARCARALGNADGDDATQAVFLVLWRRRAQAPADGPALASWLYRTTGFVIRRALRDRTRRRRAEERAPRAPEASMDEPSAIERDDVRRVLDAALAQLPRAEREAVLLTQLAGHSYAEVAEAQRCAKSTVAARVEAGLAALRGLLARRGVALSLAGLAALVADEARAEVPGALSARIQRLPAATTTGTTAVVVAARILQWSRSDVPLVKIIGASAAALACGAFLWLSGGRARAAEPVVDAVPAPVAAVAPTSAPAAPPAGAELARLVESARADTCLAARWERPAETWKRLLATPIGALVPPEAAASVAEAFAGIDRIELRFDPASSVPAEARDELQRFAARCQLLGPQEQERWMREQMDLVARGEHSQLAPDPTKIAMIGGMPAYDLDIAVATRDDAARERLRGVLAGGFGGRVAWRAGAEGFVADGTRAHLTGAIDDAGLRVRVLPDGVADATSWADVAIPWRGGSDIELHTLARPLDPQAYAAALRKPVRAVFDASVMTMAVANGRIAMTCDGSEISDAYRAALAGAAALGPEAWDHVPAEALVAAAMAVKPGDGVGGAMLQSIAAGMAMPLGKVLGVADLVQSFSELTARVDGEVLFYVEPAGVLPAATLALRCPADAMAPFLAKLRAALPADPSPDQSRVRAMIGPVPLQIGERDGRLVCTTDPRGLESFAPRGDAFARQPDVVAGLAGGGAAPALMRLVVRADKLLDLALPLASANGVPAEQTTRLQDAAKRMGEDREAGWLVMRMDEKGSRAEAGGAVALVGALVMALSATGPGHVTGVN